MTKDKQLRDIKMADVLEKRRLGQALNIKEFAVLAGISYSVACEWFQMKGFPRFEGVVFWQDFVEWRKAQRQRKTPCASVPIQTTPAGMKDLRTCRTWDQRCHGLVQI